MAKGVSRASNDELLRLRPVELLLRYNFAQPITVSISIADFSDQIFLPRLKCSMAMKTYRPEREVTPEFVERVANWVQRTGEVLIRGGVTDGLIAKLQNVVPMGREYLIVSEELRPDVPVSAVSCWDDDREHLLEVLEHVSGRVIAGGPSPDFMTDDHDGIISASKGGIDGPR